MKLSREEVFEKIKHHRFIPIFNHDNLEVCRLVLQAAYDGGVRVFEFTNRSGNALSIFSELVKYAHQNLKELTIGAGTILTAADAQAFYDAGADFIVSPIIPMDVATWSEENNVFWCPGASTLNEITLAHQLGADMVKLFPANYLGGPGYLKALRGPCPDIKMLITGGVEANKESLTSWFNAGAMAVGMGSNLFEQQIIEKRDFAAIQKNCQAVVNIIQTIN